MFFLRLGLNLFLSASAVYFQAHLNLFTQWIIIYAAVFLIAWFGGIAQGMISTVVTLSLAAYYIIPSFTGADLVEISVLICLGFWLSYSMHHYKISRLQLSTSASLDKARGFLDTLLDNIPMMVFVKDAEELRFIRFNKAGVELLGIDQTELIGKNDFDLFPSDQATEFVKNDRKVLLNGGTIETPSEFINTRNNGQRILRTKKIPIFDSQGKAVYLLGVSEDITDLVQAEKLRIETLAADAAKSERMRIQERESFVANTISSLSLTLDYHETLQRLVTLMVPSFGDWCTLTVKNEEGRYERIANHHFNSDLKPLLDEFSQNYPPGDKDIEVKKALEQGVSSLLKELDLGLLENRSQDQRKFELYKKLGSYSSMVVPIVSRGKISGALSVVRGLGRPKFDELDLMLAEEIGRRAGAVLENSLLFKSTQIAVRARDEFLSIASHELKTPITSLKMQLQMLQRSSHDDRVDKSLFNAVKQVDRLTSLVDDLLNVSKIESGKMSYHFQTLKLGELLKEVVNNLKNQFMASGIELNLEIEDDPQIEGDKYRLEQVLVNLISNSLKYGEGKPVFIKIFKNGSEAVISVRDGGRGIPIEDQKKIFEKFERGKQDSNISGLGLGLFISKEIILVHQGQILVESGINEGSEFRVILPLKKWA